MGMAIYDTYPVPRIRKIGTNWRVTWCDVHNYLWYIEFPTWKEAMDYDPLPRFLGQK